MQPTQVTSLLFATTLVHTFIKPNPALFFAGLPLYTTTIIYHNIKHYYSLNDRLKLLVCKIDSALCANLYFAALYDYYYRQVVVNPCVIMHIFLPSMFFLSKPYGALMWSDNLDVSDFWHAVFHILIIADIHMYLFSI